MNRGKLRILISVFGFSLVCFWWLCKPVCRRLMFIYCGWRGKQSEVFPTTATALFTNMLHAVTRSWWPISLKVEGAKIEVLSSGVFTSSGHQRATFVLLLAFFFTTTWNSLFSFKQRSPKETALLASLLKKTTLPTTLVWTFFFNMGAFSHDST